MKTLAGFLAVLLLAACVQGSPGNPAGNSALRNTYWKLVRLGDRPAEALEKQREAHLILSASEPRVSGSGSQLEMLDGSGAVLARFEAVALR